MSVFLKEVKGILASPEIPPTPFYKGGAYLGRHSLIWKDSDKTPPLAKGAGGISAGARPILGMVTIITQYKYKIYWQGIIQLRQYFWGHTIMNLLKFRNNIASD